MYQHCCAVHRLCHRFTRWPRVQGSIDLDMGLAAGTRAEAHLPDAPLTAPQISARLHTFQYSVASPAIVDFSLMGAFKRCTGLLLQPTVSFNLSSIHFVVVAIGGSECQHCPV